MDPTENTHYDRQEQEGYIFADDSTMCQDLALATDPFYDLPPTTLPGPSGTQSLTVKVPTAECPTTECFSDWCLPEEWPTDECSSDECPISHGPIIKSPTVSSPANKSPTVKFPTVSSSTDKSPTVQSLTVKSPTVKFASISSPTTQFPITYTKSPTDVPKYLPVHEWELCWRCGRSGHNRSNCQRPQVIFCSRCGLEGIMSRDCTCGYRSPAAPSRNCRFTRKTSTVREYVSRGVQCYYFFPREYTLRPETISAGTPPRSKTGQWT